MRYHAVYSQHAIAEALRVQRITWRFLGTLRLFLFAPARNKYGIALARSQYARSVTIGQTVSEEQTGSLVRRHCWDCRGCEHGSGQAGRETTGPGATGVAAIRTSSRPCVRPQ